MNSILFFMITVGLFAQSYDKTPVVNNADHPDEKTPEVIKTPILSPTEIMRYWIKEAKYEKALAESIRTLRERDEQTELLKKLCGKSVLMFDPVTEKVFCQ